MHAKTLQDDDDGFRNKGGALSAGKILKGTLNEAPIKLKVASIPSKYENIIYHNSTQPAFGDSKKRFFEFNSNDTSMTPGPGCYDLNKTFSKIDSKKGSGFFASQTKLQKLQRARSHGPGPGTYKSKDLQPKSLNTTSRTKLKTKQSLNTSKSTAILSSQLQYRQLFKNEIQNSKGKPSVGTYQLDHRKINKSQSTHSTFKSKINRFPNQIEKYPPIGYYNPEITPLQQGKSTKKLQIAKEATEFERQKNIKKAILNLQTKQAKEKLGPGSYQANLIATARTFKIKQSCYDRFGQLKPIYKISQAMESSNEQRFQPGHDNIESRFYPSKTYNSIFKSTTKRWQWKLNNQMDPGIYNGKKSPTKKSHLINFMQKWV